jgi:hypothetical protein
MRKKPATLRSSFETERQQRRALKALGDYFDPRELDLYDASQSAFDPSSSENEALRNFQKIYDALSSPSWGAFRSPINHLSHCHARQSKLPRYRPLTPALHQNRSPYTPIDLHWVHPSGVPRSSYL